MLILKAIILTAAIILAGCVIGSLVIYKINSKFDLLHEFMLLVFISIETACLGLSLAYFTTSPLFFCIGLIIGETLSPHSTRSQKPAESKPDNTTSTNEMLHDDIPVSKNENLKDVERLAMEAYGGADSSSQLPSELPSMKTIEIH